MNRLTVENFPEAIRHNHIPEANKINKKKFTTYNKIVEKPKTQRNLKTSREEITFKEATEQLIFQKQHEAKII